MKTGAGGKGVVAGACGGLAAGGSLREGVGDEDGVEGEGVEVGAGAGREGPPRAGKARDFLDHGVRPRPRRRVRARKVTSLRASTKIPPSPNMKICPERGVALHARGWSPPPPVTMGGDAAAVDRCVRLRGAEGGEDLVESRLGGGTVGDAEDEARVVAVRRGELDRLVEVGRVNACPLVAVAASYVGISIHLF